MPNPLKSCPGSRQSRFAELDQPALKPLPAASYEVAYWKKAMVHLDYHVEVEGLHVEWNHWPESMEYAIKERYRYLGVLKSEVLEVLAGISDVSMIQRQEMIDWAKQLSN